MDKVKKIHRYMLVILCLIVISILAAPGISVSATGMEAGQSYKLGRTTTAVNVREGAGEGLYGQVVYNGQNVTLEAGTEVIIIGSEIYQANGRVWYQIIYYIDGNELTGWVTSSRIEETGTVTPTPEPTATPTITPSPTPSPEPTPSPTATPVPATPTMPPTIDPSSGDFKFVWGCIAAIAVIGVVAIVIIFIKNKAAFSGGRGQEMSQRIKRLKNINLAESKDEDTDSERIIRTKRPEVRVVNPDDNEEYEDMPELFETDGNEELQADENAVEEASRETEEKKALRAEINRLKQHDIVIHKYFGKGEVYDNSDVKLMEVRFGSDVRFLNKDSLVSKRLLKIYEDEKRSSRKKL